MNLFFLLLLFFIPNEIYAQDNILQKCNVTDYLDCEFLDNWCLSYENPCPCFYRWGKCLKEVNCWNTNGGNYVIDACNAYDCTCEQCPWNCLPFKEHYRLVAGYFMGVACLIAIACIAYIYYRNKHINYIRMNKNTF